MKKMELKEKLYNLMDSFLVESDKPRTIKQLNQDRHLFIENCLVLFSSMNTTSKKAEKKIKQLEERIRVLEQQGCCGGHMPPNQTYFQVMPQNCRYCGLPVGQCRGHLIC